MVTHIFKLNYSFHLVIISIYLGHTTTTKIYFDNYIVGNDYVANKNV